MMQNKTINLLLWLLSFVITFISAFYQRITGPTYPKRGEIAIANESIQYKLLRSHNSGKDYKIQIRNPEAKLSGKLVFKRYKTEDPWTEEKMLAEKGLLTGNLPQQPPGGKLLYKIILSNSIEQATIPANEPVVIRFKGAVPAFILIPHIIIMFTAMLLSNRSGLEAMRKKSSASGYVIWTVILLLIGGMILGPLMQKYAFGMLWSGFPLGEDLTDTKTLIAMISWIAALIATRKRHPARFWILSAAFITLSIFFIPHSLRGTELDYSTLDQTLPH